MSRCTTCKTWTPTKDDGTCRWCGENKYEQWARARAAEAEHGPRTADDSLPAGLVVRHVTIF